MVRDSSWAQLGHVREVACRYRWAILSPGLPHEQVVRLVEAKEALFRQLRRDFGLGEKNRELLGLLGVRPEWEISAEAVELLNRLAAVVAEAEQEPWRAA